MGISFPRNDMGMKFWHNNVGISFSHYGVGTVIEKYQFLKSVVGILFPQQTLESILSEILHLANEGLWYAAWCLSTSNSNYW